MTRYLKKVRMPLHLKTPSVLLSLLPSDVSQYQSMAKVTTHDDTLFYIVFNHHEFISAIWRQAAFQLFPHCCFLFISPPAPRENMIASNMVRSLSFQLRLRVSPGSLSCSSPLQFLSDFTYPPESRLEKLKSPGRKTDMEELCIGEDRGVEVGFRIG